MRVGFSCYQLDPFQVVRELGDDVDALELMLPATGGPGVERLQQELPATIERILSVICLPTGMFIDGDDGLVPWAEAQNVLEQLGIQRLRVVGAGRGDDPNVFVDRMVDQISHLLRETASRQIHLNYENHGEPLRVLQEIISRHADDRFHILYDPLNAYLAGDAVSVVMETLLPHAGYVHVKDVRSATEGAPPVSCCPIGDGIADWRSMQAVIHQQMPHGLYVFELPGYAGDPIAGYRQSLAAFRLLHHHDS
ncbi:MAG: TIM barrel protein [Verrucomicrobia bacterium]|nr:TIM barrel protein [Verrucomicrobiota bacterium]